jgi:hypothetical protein
MLRVKQMKTVQDDVGVAVLEIIPEQDRTTVMER